MKKIDYKVTQDNILDFENKYIVVYNKFDEKIASGKVIKCKTARSLCISFDNEFFFNMNYSDFTFYESECSLEYYLNFNKSDVVHFKCDDDSVVGDTRYCIFKDNTINELDKEVEELVYLLNQVVDCTTTGSCSGHGLYNPFVQCNFYSFKPILFIIDCITSNELIKDKIVVVSQFRNMIIHDYHSDNINLNIECNRIGHDGYEDIKILCSEIKKKLCEHQYMLKC